MRKITILSIIATVCFIAAQGVFAGTYVGVMKGTICQAYVDYNDANTITVTAGYGECNGHYWEVTEPILHGMTSLTTSEDFHYIYIDDANSDYPYPTIIDSTAEPAWSNSNLGWYNGNNRCIGVVWSPQGSATIFSFNTNSSLMVISSGMKIVLQNGNPTGGWDFLETTAYIPLNAIAVSVSASNADWNGTVVARVAVYNRSETQILDDSYNGYASVTGWLQLVRNSPRDLIYMGENDDDNTFYVEITGYQIER